MNQERFEDLNCFDGSEAFAATSKCRHDRHRACGWSMSRPFEYDKKRSCAYQQNVSTAKRGLRDRESLVDEKKKTMYIEGKGQRPKAKGRKPRAKGQRAWGPKRSPIRGLGQGKAPSAVSRESCTPTENSSNVLFPNRTMCGNFKVHSYVKGFELASHHLSLELIIQRQVIFGRHVFVAFLFEGIRRAWFQVVCADSLQRSSFFVSY